MIERSKLDDFTKAYIECAMWSSTPLGDEEQENFDDYDFDDIADSALAEIIKDCQTFQKTNAKWLKAEKCKVSGNFMSQAGHDFWLTRNRHGSGFWDCGRWTPKASKAMTEYSHHCGTVDLYFGDDGKIYRN